MTDRELLELAAKAITTDIVKYNGVLFIDRREWNPLSDDGDALRLAVKLNIDIKPQYSYEGPWEDGGTLIDPYAATRRAIVRAAAEIGKGVK